MKIDWSKVKVENGERCNKVILYDVTSFFESLPSYIQSVHVLLEEYFFVEDELDKEYLEERLENLFPKGVVNDGHLSCDGESVLVSFVDGYKLRAWNSEWGGIELKRWE